MIRTAVRKERPAPTSRSVARRDMQGNELGQVDLTPEIFGIEPHEAVLHQVVTAQLAGARAGTQSTKTRAEVSGGGAKPFRQKGTGRARQGSTRSPIWSGGGVALGPKPRSYRQKTPKKMVRLALYSALSDRAAAERIALIDAWRFEVPRTKEALAALGALGLGGRVLVVLDPEDEAAALSLRNLPEVDTVSAGEISAYDVLRSDWVVFTDSTLPGASTPAGERASSTPTDDTADTPSGGDTTAAADEEVAGEAPVDEAPVAEAPVAEAPGDAAADEADGSEDASDSSGDGVDESPADSTDAGDEEGSDR